MGITQATKKQLFAASGNECAFPDCEEEIVDIEEEIVIGEIAHIRARSSNGPRFDPDLPEEERDEFSNLIVLCPNHHTRVDKNPEAYPIEELEEWKEAHRESVASSNIPDYLLDELADEDINYLQDLEEWVTETTQLWGQKVEEEFGKVESSPYQHGYWVFSYSIMEDFEQPSLAELRDLLQDTKGSESGWPPWCGVNREAKPYDGSIQAWLLSEGSSMPIPDDFWRATPDGKLFLLRGYREDRIDEMQAGQVLDHIIPIKRVGECLLHAKRLARSLSGESTSIAFHIEWTGIDGRSLGSIANRRGIWPPTEYQAHVESVQTSGEFSVSEIDENLAHVVEELTLPLYNSFDFYEPSIDLIKQQLEEMGG